MCSSDLYGTDGALSWNLERMNELRLYRVGDGRHAGYRTIQGGDRFPYDGTFVPGDANGIAYEDTIMIEDHEFLSAVAADREFRPDVRDALRFSRVQTALFDSVATGRWQPVPRRLPVGAS